MPTAQRHVQRAIIYANIPPLPLFIRCVCADGGAAMKNSNRDFHRGRRAHVLPITADQPLWLRAPIKFIHGQAVDGVAEIRRVIALRYVARDPFNVHRVRT